MTKFDKGSGSTTVNKTGPLSINLGKHNMHSRIAQILLLVVWCGCHAGCNIAKTVHEEIDHIDERLTTLTNNTLIQTKNTTQDTVNQVKSTANNFRIEFAYDMDKLVQLASKDAQLTLRELDASTTKLEKLVMNDITHFKDETLVDIRRATFNVPFIGEDFYIQRIDGTLVRTDTAGPHRVVVLGVGFGYPSQRLRPKSKLVLKSASNARVEFEGEPTGAQESTFSIDRSILRDFQKPSSIQLVPAELLVDVEKASLASKTHYRIPIALTILPEKLGNIELAVGRAPLIWVKEPKYDRIIERDLPDATSWKNHAFTEFTFDVGEVHVPPRLGDQRIYEVHVIKTEPPAGPKDNPNAANSTREHKSKGETKATMTIESWGGIVRFWVGCYVEECRFGDYEETAATIDIVQGKDVPVILPADFTVARLAVALGQGSPFTYTLSRAKPTDELPLPQPGGPLTYKTASRQGEKVIYWFSVN